MASLTGHHLHCLHTSWWRVHPCRQSGAKHHAFFPLVGSDLQKWYQGTISGNIWDVVYTQWHVTETFRPSTLASSGVADVDAVHPHVDVILHVTPLLVVVEDKTSISPQVEPVLLPPAEDGACEEKRVTGTLLTIYTGLASPLWLDFDGVGFRPQLTLTMKPAALYHCHVSGGAVYKWDVKHNHVNT